MRAFSFVTWQLMAAAVSWAVWVVLSIGLDAPNFGSMKTAIYLWVLLAVLVPYLRRSKRSRVDA
jgi:hypothetical protein